LEKSFSLFAYYIQLILLLRQLREKATDYIEDRFLSTRHLQEEIDTLNMFHVSQFYKNFRQKRKSNPDYGKIDVTMEEQRGS